MKVSYYIVFLKYDLCVELYRSYAFDWDISLYKNPDQYKVNGTDTHMISSEEEAELLETGLSCCHSLWEWGMDREHESITFCCILFRKKDKKLLMKKSSVQLEL
jgi:hypothetical protein